MAKPTGATLMTLLVGAGVILHSSPGHIALSPQVHEQAAHASATASAGEGPWVASCDYWRPLRRIATQPPPKTTDAQEPYGPVDCRSDPWGVPADSKGPHRTAHAVIALVPDPVHSHLAPEFDRALDVLMGAASDNGYLVSYSWLPWKAPNSKAEGHLEKSREGEPGLLVFDQRSTSGETTTVLYLFLVAEMPSTGVNAEQLTRALKYELQLRSQLGSKFATDDAGYLRVIGPQYSGSAMSLNLAINTVLMDGSINPEPGSVKKRKIFGMTSTEPARLILNRCDVDPNTSATSPANPECTHPETSYASFASGQAVSALKNLMTTGHYREGDGAVLEEDGTFYGRWSDPKSGKDQQAPASTPFTWIPFPREMSLLRNSYQESAPEKAAGDDAAPTPYLRMTTHDDGSPDTLPDLSATVTPLSQEAQLMSIAHTLDQRRVKFAYIAASNPLDALFLAKSLHRSNPDTRLVMEPDLLMQREGDDAPYIGSLGLTPYPLVWMGRSDSEMGLRSFASSEMEAYYNAASFTLGTLMQGAKPPSIYGYKSSLGSGDCLSPASDGACPRLWLTTVGNDGYYPIALLRDSSRIMGIPTASTPANAATSKELLTIYPPGVWLGLCVGISLLSLFHMVMLASATYTSVQTCDLDIHQNCEPHRRMLYCQLGGAVLFLMAAVITFPASAFAGGQSGFRVNATTTVIAAATLGIGAAAWLMAIVKTWRSRPERFGDRRSFLGASEGALCMALYFGGIVATLILASLWLVLCHRSVNDQKLGLFFSYRCLHPFSGVSPLAPALLLLSGWFLWAVLHARRLRLTRHSRPRLPDEANMELPTCRREPGQKNLFLSDGRVRHNLLEDATCLMISRRLLHQAFGIDPERLAKTGRLGNRAHWVDAALVLLFFCIAAAWLFVCPMVTLDSFAPVIASTTLFELFIGLLLVPLLVIAICAAVRLFLISGSLREQLLEPLERMPLRHAFTRLKGFSWVSMLGNSGQLERWRDMARSTESLRQIANHRDLPRLCDAAVLKKRLRYLSLTTDFLQRHLAKLHEKDRPPTRFRACLHIERIEKIYAGCAEQILSDLLLPYWKTKSRNLLESEPEKEIKEEPVEFANLILLAEEFLAFRYVALIRAVLAQMRYLLIFIAAALVLVMLAINSYPFQPRQELDWCITVVFFSFLIGLVIVFAQMHRNPLLSRITNKEHGLGTDFYLRVAAFGALPLVTWLATQYPSIGGTLYGVLKPGLEAFK